jgi:7-carboxy-7-deazaguanine synthase
MSINVFEIFFSLQGESSFQGIPCVFIRLAGCNLRCKWCDTKDSQNENGNLMEIDEILEKVRSYNPYLVEVTGGEPLIQKETPELLNALVEENYKVLLETSGSESIENISRNVHIIMDVKPPSSGEEKKLKVSNFDFLKDDDEVKFPVANLVDFNYGLDILEKFAKKKFDVLFTPVTPDIKPATLAKWVLEKAPPNSRFQIQLHKFLEIP